MMMPLLTDNIDHNCPSNVAFQFTQNDAIIVGSYCILFVIAAIGNCAMLIILYKKLFTNYHHRHHYQCCNHDHQQHTNKRMLSLLLHMNIADLIVTFGTLPKTIIHKLIVGWYGGEMLCKFYKFFDVFGVFLSSNILICMCIDRFFSVYSPLSALSGLRRVKTMIYVAWISAIIVSLPQLFLWVTASPECNRSFTQCVTRSFIGQLNPRITLVYTIITAVQSYFLPLCVIIVCYTFIFCRLNNTVKLHRIVISDDQNTSLTSSADQFVDPRNRPPLLQRTTARASGAHLVSLRRAKSRTLHMTLIIIAFFFICWTPYYMAASIRFFDMDYSTGRIKGNIPVPSLLIDLLYVFSSINSSLNAYIYGYFSFDLKKELKNLFQFNKTSSCSAPVSIRRFDTVTNEQRGMTTRFDATAMVDSSSNN